MTRRGDALIGHLRQVLATPTGAELSDAELIERFRSGRGETDGAFAALVRRHGRAVWGVCRRVLGHEQDAEDAFQATFLVLARRAGRLRKGEAVASWLHGVARRVALAAQRAAARRRARERNAPVRPDAGSAALAASVREVQAVLDEEVARLPPAERAAFVLCCLGARTAAEAARELGRAEGAVAVAFGRARKRLARRLAERGVTLATALGAFSLATAAAAPVPATLVKDTIRLVLLTGPAAAGSVPPAVAVLAEGVIQAMTPIKLRTVLVLVALALGGLLGLAAAQQPPARPVGPAPGDQPAAAPAARPPTDRFGDPLPRGAVARLGTRRLHHTAAVASVSFSPDGKTLASVATPEAAVSLWDGATGVPAGRLRIQGKACSAAFSPDGKSLAVGALGPRNAAEVQIWDVAARELVRRFDAGEQFWLGPLAYSPDGKMLATTRREPTGKAVVRLWEAATGKALHAFEEHTGEVRDLAFSPDGKTLATTGSDDRVILWDTGTGTKARELKAGGAWSVVFSPNGGQVYASRNTAVEAWEVATGKAVRQFETRFGGTTRMALSPDGKTVAACGVRYDAERQALVRCLFLWDAATGKELRHFDRTQEELGRLVFSPDGKSLASTGNGGSTAVRLWDAATGKAVLGDEAVGGRVDSVSVSADGRRIATGERLWDAANGRLLRVLGADGYFPSGVSVFGPGGHTLASGSRGEGGAVSLWDAAAGREERRLPGGEVGIVRRLSFSADGRVVACSGGPNIPPPPAKSELRVRLWDAARGKEVGRFRAEQDWPADGVLSPDGRLFAAGGYSDGSVALWDTATGKEARRLRGHAAMVNAVAFSPDGTSLASGASDMTVGLWDVGTGRLLRRLDKGHHAAIACVAFAPDGRAVASGGLDHAVCLWEASTGKVRRLFEGHQGAVRAVAFAPDGRRLVSGGEDGTGLVWDVSGRAAAGAGPARLSAEELQALWGQLSGEDAGAAYRAVWDLAAAPGQSVPFLRGRVRPAAPLDAAARARVERLVGELSADEFAARERATEALSELGEAAVPALRKALAVNASPEASRRLEELLNRAEGLSGDRLRAVRALEALEHCGTVEALAAIRELIGGDPAARITAEAKAAAERLAKRGGKP